MKKWLVGLMAAGLCAASAWATTDTLDRAFTGVEAKASYVEWSGKTGESGAVYAGQSAGDKDSIQLRSNNNNSGIVTTGSGGTATKVTVAWNENTADDREVSVYGKADAYSAATDLYSKDAQGTLIGSIKKGESTELSLGDGYEFIGLRSKSGALYLDSVEIEWGGEAPPKEFSVSLALSGESEIEQGSEGAYVTATPKNAAEGVVGYEWTSENGGSGADNVYTIDTKVTGDFTVSVKATDAEGNEAEDSIEFTIVPEKKSYAVSVWDGIQNGTVEIKVGDADPVAGPVDVKEGTVVTVVATPADNYKVDTITVTTEGGETVELSKSNTFEMPGEAVSVTATFVEKPAVTGDELTNADVGHQSSSYKDWTAEKESGAVYAGQTAGGSATNPCIQLRATSPSGIVMTKGSGKNVSSVIVEWNAQSGADRVVQVYGSTTAYASTADLYGDAAGTFLGAVTNGAAEATVDVAAAGEYPFIGVRSKSGALYLTSVAIDFAGAAGPSVSLSASATSVEVKEDLTITATATGFSDEVTWSWEGNDGGSGVGAVYTVNTLVAGEYTIMATATCGEETKSESITVTVTPELVAHNVTVTVTEGEGTAEADVAEAKKGATVNLTINPGDGYKVGSITVNGTAITGTSFEMLDEDVTVLVAFMLKPVVLGDVLTNTDVGHQTTSYKDWTATKESGAVYAGQSAGGSATNPCIQLRTTSPAGIVMTKGNGQNVSAVTIEWNAQSANGRIVQVYGSATAYSTSADLYGDAKGTLLGAVTNGADEVTVDVAAAGEYPFIGILAKGGALYLTSVTVAFGGEAKPSISGTVESEMLLGGTASATFTLGGATATGWTASLGSIEDGAWSWTPSAAGTFTLEVTATYDGGSAEASFPIVVTDPSAFDRYTKVTSIDGLEDGEYLVVGASSNLDYFAMTAGLSSGVALGTEVEVKTDEEVPYILEGNADLVWTVTYDASAGLTISSAKDKYLGYDSTKKDNKLWSFEEVADASTWTVAFSEESALFTLTSKVQDSEGLDRCLRFNYNNGNTRFSGYKASSSGMKDVALFKKGAAGPSISYTGDTTVKIPDSFSLQFTLKNYDGAYTWAMDSREGGTIDAESGLYTWKPGEAGEVTIKVKAVDGETEIASKEVPLTVLAADPDQPSVTCDRGEYVECEAGSEQTFVFTAVNFEAAYWDVWVNDEHQDTLDVDGNTATFTWKAGSDGSYNIEAQATDAGGEVEEHCFVTVMVGAAAEPYIKSITVDAKEGKLSLKLPEAGAKVLRTADLVAGRWEEYPVAAGEDGVLEIPMDEGQMFYRAP